MGYRTFEDALRAAGHGVLYCYVAPSLGHGWLPNSEASQLRWYEKLVAVDRFESADFLRSVGADEQFALIAVGQGFAIFVARNAEELSKKRDLVRPWVESLVQSYVAKGVINPQAYKFPGDD